jgi:lambda family phage portal protein
MASIFTRPLRSVGRFFLNLNQGAYQAGERHSAWARRWQTNKARRADEEILLDRPVLVERSRSLYRNNAIGRAAITTHLYNSVGRGFTLNCAIDAEALGMTPEQKNQWEATTERGWANYANSTECDAEGQMTFPEMTGLVALTKLIDGEAFAILKNIPRLNHLYTLRAKLVDTSVVTQPRGIPSSDYLWRDGVRLDINGRPVAYGLRNPDLTTYEIPAFGYKSGRRNVLHVFRKEFPGQSRGLPFLSAVMRELRKIEEYTKAELESAVVAAMFTAFVKSSDSTILDSPITDTNGGPAIATDEYSLGPAAIMKLQPGEDVTFANPGRPNTGFAQYVDFMVKIICAGLNLSYETVMKTFQSSYSATKGAQNETRKFFAVEKQWIANRWCQPFYEEWLTEEVIAGRIVAPGFLTDVAARRAYCRAEWIGETTGSVDLMAELNASEKLVQLGYSTRQREAAQFTGQDWYGNQKVLRQEQVDAATPPDGVANG